jgi:phthalate 3,4-dioxygenase subunit beta
MTAIVPTDIRNVMAVRMTMACAACSDAPVGMERLNRSKYSLSRRVVRFTVGHAWTEDPPSRLRRYVSNVRAFEPPGQRNSLSSLRPCCTEVAAMSARRH